MSWYMLALAALGAPAPVQGEEIRQFSGGHYDGLRFRVSGPAIELLPAVPEASPVSADYAPAINGLIQAFRSGERSDYSAVSTDDAQIFLARDGCLLPHEVGDGQKCAPQPLHDVSFGEECVAGTPYQLPDQIVRIEWTCDGRFSYLSWFSLREGRIALGALQDAVAPQLLRQ